MVHSDASKTSPVDVNDDVVGDFTKDEPVKARKTFIKHVKDQGYGWVVAIASLISHMLTDGIIYSYGVLAPEFIKHYDISRSTVGWMGSTLVAVTLASGPLASYLCMKLSYRTVSIIGSVVSIIGFGAPFFYNELWFLILTSSVVCGIGFGLVYLPSIIIVNVWFEKRRALALGIAVCGAGLGTFVMSPLLQVLLTMFNWQLTMLITSGILLLLVPCSLTYIDFKGYDIIEVPSHSKDNDTAMKLLMDENKENKTNQLDVEGVYRENQGSEEKLKNVSSESFTMALSGELMKDPIFLLFLISNVFSSIGFNAPYMFAKDRAIQLGISAEKGSFLISTMGIGNFLGRIGYGILGNIKSLHRFHLFNFSIVISGLILIFSWVLNHYIFMIAYTTIYGFNIGGFVTLTSVILVDIFGLEKLNATFGLSLIFQGVAVLLGPPFAGFIYDFTLSYDISFAVCGLFIAVSGLMMYLAYLSKNFRKKKFKG